MGMTNAMGFGHLFARVFVTCDKIPVIHLACVTSIVPHRTIFRWSCDMWDVKDNPELGPIGYTITFHVPLGVHDHAMVLVARDGYLGNQKLIGGGNWPSWVDQEDRSIIHEQPVGFRPLREVNAYRRYVPFVISIRDTNREPRIISELRLDIIQNCSGVSIQNC